MSENKEKRGNKRGNKSHILSYEQKLQLVEDWKNAKVDYSTLAGKYGISYCAARSICEKYEKSGIEGLIKKRHSIAPKAIPESPFAKEIKILKKKLKRAELEIEVLKKLERWINQEK